MRMFEAWRRTVSWSRSPDTRDTRLAFQAGARYAMSELIEHLDGSDETTVAANKLNDDIHAFATVALLDQ